MSMPRFTLLAIVACSLLVTFAPSNTDAAALYESGVDCGNWTSCWSCALGRTSCIWNATAQTCTNSDNINVWTNITSCPDRPAFIDALADCVTIGSDAMSYSTYDQIVEKTFFSCGSGTNVCSSDSCTSDIQCIANMIHAYQGQDCYTIETDTTGTVAKCNSSDFLTPCTQTCADYCTSEITKCGDWKNCWTCATGSISCVWSPTTGCSTSSNINVWTNASSCTDTPAFLSTLSTCYDDRTIALSYSSFDALSSCDEDVCSNSDCRQNLQCLTDTIHHYDGQTCFSDDEAGTTANCSFATYSAQCQVIASGCKSVCTVSSSSRTSFAIFSALAVLLAAFVF